MSLQQPVWVCSLDLPLGRNNGSKVQVLCCFKPELSVPCSPCEHNALLLFVISMSK